MRYDMIGCENLPTFYDWEEPVAKKRHRCCECEAFILKGEKYFAGTGKWDGQVQTFRQHLVCMEACMLIRDEFNGGECIAFGDMMEAFSEIKSDYHPSRECDIERVKKLRHLMAVIKNRQRKS